MDNQNNKRNFKGIWIPKEVWLNKELSLQEKVFLVEIDSLDNEKGCYASNKYFSDFFSISKGRCSQIINSLKDKGYIKIDYEYEGKNIKKRIMRTTLKYIRMDKHLFNKLNTPSKNTKDPIKNIKHPYLENDKENNTTNNNTTNNKYIDDFFNECWTIYPNKKGKGKISYSKKKEIYKLGDEFKRCIERYIKDTAAKRQEFPNLKYQYGSTFWNSGYVDYLDENYGGEECATGDNTGRINDNAGENTKDGFTEEDAKRAGIISL